MYIRTCEYALAHIYLCEGFPIAGQPALVCLHPCTAVASSKSNQYITSFKDKSEKILLIKLIKLLQQDGCNIMHEASK